jgi:hypothetical protein
MSGSAANLEGAIGPAKPKKKSAEMNLGLSVIKEGG